MTNYLLSIDPSINNTGFTLGEKRCHVIDCENNNCIELKLGKPIFVNSYSFKNINIHSGMQIFIINMIRKIKIITYNELDLIIERGFPNMMGSETLDHLRGFIAGQFNKLLTKDMLISPRTGQNGCFNILKNNNYCGLKGISNKGEKGYSLVLVEGLIEKNNGNIKINNHDEADSLLIGGYYLNKEVK